MITQQRLKEVIDYDPATGRFAWRETGKGRNHLEAGDINKNGYRRICIDGSRYMAHRLAFLFITGKLPARDVDHRNGVRADNAWSNLRECSRSQNNENQRQAQRGNKSGYLGVSPNRGRWSASIAVDGKKLHIGTFDTPQLAHKAYIEKKRQVHKGNML